MNTEQLDSEFFIAGGTLTANARSYVKRSADDELFRHSMDGEYCYILTARQMGKSSLMIRTSQHLSKEGVKSAIVDLAKIGKVDSEDQWYKGILTQIKKGLRLGIDSVTWWERKGDISNIQKFIEFFEEVLSEVKEHTVIFIDEIDVTLDLDFRDNFFAGVRAIYNARADNPEFGRIAFVLLGVASPSDLIKDRSRTPFNIGSEISLTNLSREDATVLVKGLEQVYPGSGERILDRIFHWTDGHPYFTQKLCMEIVERKTGNWGDQEIDQLVSELFLSGQARNETNIRFVQDRLLNSPNRVRILKLQKKILRGGIRQDVKSSLQNELRLSGLVDSRDGILRVNNRIYETVFNLQWIKEHSPKNFIRAVVPYLAGVALVALAIIIYNLIVLPIREYYYAGKFTSPQSSSSEKLMNLANLFNLHGFLSNNDFDSQARNLYFDSNWDNQTRIFQDSSITLSEKQSSLSVVVSGLYVTMANVEDGEDSSELLGIMSNSLTDILGTENSSLRNEIKLWLDARNASTDQEAFDKYNLTIRLNKDNPATHYERALVALRLGDNETALLDLEATLGLALNMFEKRSPSSSDSVSLDGRNYRSNFYTMEYVHNAVNNVIQDNLQDTNFRTALILAKTETNVYTNLESAGLLGKVNELVGKFATQISMDSTQSSKAQAQQSTSEAQSTNAHIQILTATAQIFGYQAQLLTAQAPFLSVIVNTTSNCRSGTSTEFERIVQIPEGITVEVVGRNGQGDYLFIKWDTYECWIPTDQVKVNYDPTPIPTIPTPTLPPIPPTPPNGPCGFCVSAPSEVTCSLGGGCPVRVIVRNAPPGNVCVYVQPREVPGQNYWFQFSGTSGNANIGDAPDGTPFVIFAVSRSSCPGGQQTSLPPGISARPATVIRHNEN